MRLFDWWHEDSGWWHTIWKLEGSMDLERGSWLDYLGVCLKAPALGLKWGRGHIKPPWACFVWENCALLRLLSETDETMPRWSLVCSKGSTIGNNCHHDQPLSLSFTNAPALWVWRAVLHKEQLSGYKEHACLYWALTGSMECGAGHGPNQGFTCLSYASAWLPVFPLALLHEELYVPVWAVWNPGQVSGSVNPTVRRTEKLSNPKGHSCVTGSQFQHFFNLQVAEAKKQALRTNMRMLHNGFPQPSLLHRLGSPWYLPLCKVYVDGMKRIGVRPRVFKSVLFLHVGCWPNAIGTRASWIILTIKWQKSYKAF